jgi:CTP synthase
VTNASSSTGTQAHPELTSRPLRPSPMFLGFIKTSLDYAATPAGVEEAV